VNEEDLLWVASESHSRIYHRSDPRAVFATEEEAEEYVEDQRGDYRIDPVTDRS